MKKIFALSLCFVMLFALCACGNDENKGSDTNGNSSVVSQVDGNNGNDTKKEGKEAYLGSWIHERTDAEPYRMTLELKADGTGKNGNTSIEWTYDESTKQISITIIYPDGEKSSATPAKLTEKGDISWEREFNIKTQSGEMLKFDKTIFVKQ